MTHHASHIFFFMTNHESNKSFSMHPDHHSNKGFSMTHHHSNQNVLMIHHHRNKKISMTHHHRKRNFSVTHHHSNRFFFNDYSQEQQKLVNYPSPVLAKSFSFSCRTAVWQIAGQNPNFVGQFYRYMLSL